MSMAYRGDNEVIIESMAEDIIFGSGQVHTIRAVACANCETMTYSVKENKQQFVHRIRLDGWRIKNQQWHCNNC